MHSYMKTGVFSFTLHKQINMLKNLSIFAAIFLTTSASGQLAVQQWRDHFPNTGTVDVTAGGGRIFAANPQMVYAVNLADNGIEKYTKVNRLSDVGIASIGYDETSGTLVVGYESGNLDLLQTTGTMNVKSIQNSGVLGLKSINNIQTYNGRCYLSCGFGIVYYDLVNQEVIDTYIIGPGGANLQVNETVLWNGFLYAATDIGLFRADESSSFLANFQNWEQVINFPDFGKVISDVKVLNNKLFFVQKHNGSDDIIFASSNLLNYTEVATSTVFLGIDVSENRLIARRDNGIDLYDSDFNYMHHVDVGSSGNAVSEGAVLRSNGELWFGDNRRGLVRYRLDSQSHESIQPSGPNHRDLYRLKFVNGKLFKTSGGPASNWGATFNPNGLEVLDGGEWTAYDRYTLPIINQENLRDLLVVAVDPKEENHWFVGTWGAGVMEFNDGVVTELFNHENSPLQGAPELAGRAGIAGMQYDDNGVLWMTNGYSTKPIVALTPEGEWHAFSATAAGAGGSDLYSDMIITSSGYKWCLRPRGHGIVVYDDNNTLDDASDDQAIQLTNQVGQGNLPTLDVYSIAEDLNGEVWVGTGEGIVVFYSAGGVFSNSNFDAQQILIEQGGNIQILLETEQVRSIAVDGANRKWLGTASSGVFLMSADGTEQVAHFTTSNSPLPSNTLQTIAIDGETGEVFFGTDEGIVSYKGTATDGRTENDCAKVYPNPVREHYTGPVAITGLERNTNVKITDVAGNIVFETTSEGGQAIWHANDAYGERVTTGVYTALCSAPEGNSKCVAKIMVIR